MRVELIWSPHEIRSVVMLLDVEELGNFFVGNFQREITPKGYNPSNLHV